MSVSPFEKYWIRWDLCSLSEKIGTRLSAHMLVPPGKKCRVVVGGFLPEVVP